MVDIKTEEEFASKIATGKFIVDFYSSTCMPCKMLIPVLQKVEPELNSKGISVLKVNVGEVPALANNYSINMVPTMKFFVDGIEVHTLNGLVSEGTLLSNLDAFNS